MFRVVCFLAVVGCAFGSVLPPNGFLPDGRIVGGIATTIEEYPYQVSLQRNGRHSCGGSIITPEIIVTAAHCLQNVPNVGILSVRVGSTLHKSGGTVHRVVNFINHERYTDATAGNDVAVIRVTPPISMGAAAQPIALATSTPIPGTRVLITGWGTTRQGAFTLPEVLQRVEQFIVAKLECSRSYSPLRITTTMMCAADTGKDSCQGDSGGPLVANNELVGIVSWGRGCAQPGYPGVYAEVSALNSWILATSQTV